MKFFKLVRYDLGRNLLAKPGKWLVMGVLFAFFFLCFSLDALHLFWSGTSLSENIEAYKELHLSFGDAVLYHTGGMLPVRFASLTDNFAFPVKWLLPHMLVLYFTLSYASDDMTHYGLQVLTRARNKRAWWLSKCLWNILTVFSCFIVGFGILFLLSLVTGKSMDFSFNDALFNDIFGEVLPSQTASPGEYFAALCVMPAAVCAAVSLMQMTLTLYVKPVFAYIAACVYYIAGAYYANPLLISNYAMTVRSAAIGFYNFRAGSGLALCLAFSAAAAVIGAARLENMDFVNNA